MQGFDTVDVQQGTLGLSGNNDGFTGKITVRKDASLSAKAESLPVNHPVNGNVGNIDLTNGGTLILNRMIMAAIRADNRRRLGNKNRQRHRGIAAGCRRQYLQRCHYH